MSLTIFKYHRRLEETVRATSDLNHASRYLSMLVGFFYMIHRFSPSSKFDASRLVMIQSFYKIDGFGYHLVMCHILTLGLMYCQKFLGEKMDKNKSEAHSPCAKFN